MPPTASVARRPPLARPSARRHSPTTLSYNYAGAGMARIVGGNVDPYGSDCENRLVSLTKNTVVGEDTYAYDHRTQRVSRYEAPAGGTATTTSIVFSGRD